MVISFQFTLILCRERRGEPRNVKGVEEASQQEWAVIQERGRGVISKVLSAFGSCPGLLGAQGSRSVRDRVSDTVGRDTGKTGLEVGQRPRGEDTACMDRMVAPNSMPGLKPWNL